MTTITLSIPDWIVLALTIIWVIYLVTLIVNGIYKLKLYYAYKRLKDAGFLDEEKTSDSTKADM